MRPQPTVATDIPVASPVRVGKRTGILLAAKTSDGRRGVRFDDSPAVPEVVEEGKLVKVSPDRPIFPSRP